MVTAAFRQENICREGGKILQPLLKIWSRMQISEKIEHRTGDVPCRTAVP